MEDKEKIRAAVAMLRQVKRMVGFFMKKEISELIEKLEKPEHGENKVRSKEQRVKIEN